MTAVARFEMQVWPRSAAAAWRFAGLPGGCRTKNGGHAYAAVAAECFSAHEQPPKPNDQQAGGA